MQLIARTLLVTGLASLTLVLASAPARGQQLFGVDWDTRRLFRISTADATSTPVGTTGSLALAGLEFGPGNVLYAITTVDAHLFRIDPTTGAATDIGSLGFYGVFEGALAFSPGGVAYGTNMDSAATPRLFTIDLQSGAATLVGQIGTGRHDVNGLAWRSDGELIGIDRETNALLVIDPGTAAVSSIIPLGVTVGAVSGMSARGDEGFFNTSGPSGSYPGTNELFSVDLFSGAHTLIGSLQSTTHGIGVSGLAWDQTPSPATYCTAKVNSQGCTPAIGSTGTPSASAGNGFVIDCSNARENKFGILFYGTNGPLGAPFQGGFLCVQPPTKRVGHQSSIGTGPCNGTYAYDFNVRISSGLDPNLIVGASVHTQWWMRDPQSPSTTGLSDGLAFVICQ